MPKKNSILEIIRENKSRVKEMGVKRIGVFGSFIKSVQTPKSDIDILVEFEKGSKTFDNYMELKFFLQRLLGRKVDLVLKNAIKPRLKLHIAKEVRYA